MRWDAALLANGYVPGRVVGGVENEQDKLVSRIFGYVRCDVERELIVPARVGSDLHTIDKDRRLVVDCGKVQHDIVRKGLGDLESATVPAERRLLCYTRESTPTG
jgi:hypothetical protein